MYRSIVGALQYLTMTRPDITYAVNQLCQFMHAPKNSHLAAVKRILRYLKGTLGLGLSFRASSDFSLTAYSDADWAGCPDDRRSTTGSCIFLGPNLISWSSKKQPTVSRSSAEAEYRAVALTTADLHWIQFLVKDVGLFTVSTPRLFCDNISATYLAINPILHSRTQHIEIDYHFVRERVARGALLVQYVSTKDQIADLFTKGLSSVRYRFLRDKLSLCSSPRSA